MLTGGLGRETGPASSSVCGDCLPHVQSNMQANREHLVLWAAYAGHVQALGEQTAAELRALLASKDAELANRPEKIVDRYVDADKLEDARTEADRAFRSRDRAYRALIAIRIQHRELDDRKCRCGLKFDQCNIGQALGSYPGLLGWEKRQIERARRDEPHQLPDNHPALLDRRWTETARDEWVRRIVVYDGPARLADALHDELWDRGVEVDEDDGRQRGDTWTVPVTGPEKAIAEALRAFEQRHQRTRVHANEPTD